MSQLAKDILADEDFLPDEKEIMEVCEALLAAEAEVERLTKALRDL
jgi:hypothetical protein